MKVKVFFRIIFFSRTDVWKYYLKNVGKCRKFWHILRVTQNILNFINTVIRCNYTATILVNFETSSKYNQSENINGIIYNIYINSMKRITYNK